MPLKRAKTSTKPDSTRAPSRTTRQTRKTTNVIASDEDVTEGLVTSRKGRTSRTTSQNDAHMVVAGGLGARDESTGEQNGTQSEKGATEESPRMSEEAEIVPKRNVRKRPAKVVKRSAQSEDKKRAMEDLRKRMEADKRANAQGVSLGQRNQSNLPDTTNAQADRPQSEAAQKSPSPVAQAVPGTAPRPPQSALKVQSTPGVESSVLALANFRRRARQPSLLRMVQGDLSHSTPGEDTTDFTLGDDEDDFAPHDESTPLKIAKAQQLEAQTQPQTQAEEDDDDDLYGVSPQPAKSRKRKSDEMEDGPEVEVIRSSPSRLSSPLPSANDLPEDITIPATAPEEAEEEAEDDDSEPRRASVDHELYADPLSSSPPPMPRQSPIQPASKRGGPRKASAHPPEQSRTSRHKSQRSLDTAALRALLPKRRIRDDFRNEYDHPTSSDITQISSEMDGDEDELTHRIRGKRITKTSAQKKQPAKKTVPSSKTKRKPVTSKAVTQPSTTKRTYGRASGVSDKENDSSSPLSELTSDEGEADREGTGDTSLETVAPKKQRVPLSSELQAAKAKFAEVDDWQMEFESAPSLDAADNSSPWR